MTPQLFSDSSNINAEEFKKYIPVNINLRFETISSYLISSENKYIKPLLGESLFEKLVLHYQNEESVNIKLDYLLDLVRYAEIRLAIWQGFDVIASMISDAGIAMNVEKENRLFRYQEENLRRSLKNDGFNQLDTILEYLEANISDFPEFETSKYFTKLKNSLIRNTSDFNEYFSIDNSRLVFLKMKNYIRDVELLTLRHRIGSSFYCELLAADNSEKYERILSDIKCFVVYSAVADGIGELHKLPTEKGLVFENIDLEGIEIQPIEKTQLAETRIKFSQKAEKYLSAAINTIKEHPSDYPAYTLFAGESPADGIIHIDNSNKKTFLA